MVRTHHDAHEIDHRVSTAGRAVIGSDPTVGRTGLGAPGPRLVRPDRDVAARVEISYLQAELERRDRRIQHVIDRYEGLLAEKERHAERHRAAEVEDPRGSLTSRLRRYLPGR